MAPARLVGPAQALWARRVNATTPAAFCAALLGTLAYALPEDVPAPTWQLALRHLAERQPTEPVFRRLLEQRATRGQGASSDPGSRVASYLLREWERYQRARQLAPAGPSRRRRGQTAAPGQRPGGRGRGRDRAARAILLQRLGLSDTTGQPTEKRRVAPAPPVQPDTGG
jgi:hypothetical protein